MFYDLCVRALMQELQKTLEFAGELGWNGICLLANRSEIKNLKAAVKKAKGLDVSAGLLLQPHSKNELKRQVSANRKNFELIAVKGGSPEMNRSALETRGVDILIEWETAGEGHKKTLDYVMVKLAAENHVSIAFSLHPLVAAYDRSRAGVMAKFIEAAKFVREYKGPFVLTSGAFSPWDLRSPSELAAFGNVLGFNGRETKEALSGSILEENRKRLSGKWVMPGVEVE